jgi:small subunit ribosomal protein S2
MAHVTVQQLLLAGSHFGHLTRRWNPKMRKYIFMEKNGVHILDLKKTEFMLEEAVNAIGKIVAAGGDILFVGTKEQARDIMKEEASKCTMHYVSERWLGGMLTNFRTIRNSVKTLEMLETKATDGTYEKISKKEILFIERDKEKLLKVLGGIRAMNKLPGAVFVVDTIRESIAINEARKLKIPVFGICDTNSDPDRVDYAIPANDDSYKSIAIITKSLADAAEEARMLRKGGFGAEGELSAPKKDNAEAPRKRRRKSETPVKAKPAAAASAAPVAPADVKPKAEAKPKAAPKAEAKPKAAPKAKAAAKPKAAPKAEAKPKAAPKAKAAEPVVASKETAAPEEKKSADSAE